MLAKAFVAGAMLIATGLITSPRAESHVERSPLGALPFQLDDWRGREAPPFEDDVVSQLGVDEYVNRVYIGAGTMVGLYVGYYTSQRQGDTIHSPQNCLPGAGCHPSHRTPSRFQTVPPQRGSTITSFKKGLSVRSSCIGTRPRRAWSPMSTRIRRCSCGMPRGCTAPTPGWYASSLLWSAVPDDATGAASQFASVLLPRLTEHLP